MCICRTMAIWCSFYTLGEDSEFVKLHLPDLHSPCEQRLGKSTYQEQRT
jgi:hypothetical protein